MGFLDSFKIVVFNTQVYRQSGNNNIVTIFEHLLKNILNKRRKQQDKLRKNVINKYNKCQITELDYDELLVCSHLKP